MKIEYIYHSGFTVETDDYLLVFDYYRGDIKLKDKKTLVFASHGHHDHFSPDIFNWQKDNPNISYVLSSDIKVDLNKNIYTMSPYEKLNIGDIEIKTFGSTDLGVSFLVKLDGKYIFHAGDLNWWHWEDDTIEEQSKEEQDFKSEVDKIDKVDLDIAFFPVDPRLGDGFYYGGKYFIEQLRPKIFFPMHFGDKPEISRDFIHKVKDIDVNILEIEGVNQMFEIN